MPTVPTDSMCSICEMGFDSVGGPTVTDPVRCEKCGKTAHADCWLERGGCASPTCNPDVETTHVRAPAEPADPRDGEAVDDVIQILDVKDGAGSSASMPLRRAEPRSVSVWDAGRGSAPDLEITITREDVGAAPAAARGLGPLGRVRSPGAVVAFHFLTFGFYHLRWVYVLFQEATTHADRRRGVRIPDPGTFVAVHVATPMIVLLLGTALFFLAKGAPLAAGVAVVGTIALALSFAVPGWVQIAGLVGRMREAGGSPPEADGPTAAWWMLVPVAGALVFCAIVQERTNAYWQQAGRG